MSIKRLAAAAAVAAGLGMSASTVNAGFAGSAPLDPAPCPSWQRGCSGAPNSGAPNPGYGGSGSQPPMAPAPHSTQPPPYTPPPSSTPPPHSTQPPPPPEHAAAA